MSHSNYNSQKSFQRKYPSGPSRDRYPSPHVTARPVSEARYPSRSSRFDLHLNPDSWVNFILQLKHQESVKFGSAGETIRTEAYKEFLYPCYPTMSLASQVQWRKTLQGEEHSNRTKIIMEEAKKYDVDCREAVDKILSSEYMSDSLRNRIENHDLYSKVKTNQLPTVEECVKYCLGSIDFICNKSGSIIEYSNVSSQSPIMADLAAEHESDPGPRVKKTNIKSEDDQSAVSTGSVSTRSTAGASPSGRASSKAAAVSAPVDPMNEIQEYQPSLINTGVQSKNLVLLLRIIRSIVLKLSSEHQHVPRQHLESCWQDRLRFDTWLEIYRERFTIAQCVSASPYTEKDQFDHFFTRISEEQHWDIVTIIRAMRPSPSLSEAISMIREDISRKETRHSEYESTMSTRPYGRASQPPMRHHVGLYTTNPVNNTYRGGDHSPVPYRGHQNSNYQPPRGSSQSYDRSPAQPKYPCRHCGGAHWNRECQLHSTSSSLGASASSSAAATASVSSSVPSAAASSGGRVSSATNPSNKSNGKPVLSQKTANHAKVIVNECECGLCGTLHGPAECPIIQQAKVIRDAKISSSKKQSVSESIHQLNKAYANLSSSLSMDEIRAVTNSASKTVLFTKPDVGTYESNRTFADVVATNTVQKAIGLMSGIDNLSRFSQQLIFDTGSQINVVRDAALLCDFRHCHQNIVLAGIVTGDSSEPVVSQGCGSLLGMECYYIPEATNNLISIGELRKHNFTVHTDGGTKYTVKSADDIIVMEASLSNNIAVVDWCLDPLIQAWIVRENFVQHVLSRDKYNDRVELSASYHAKLLSEGKFSTTAQAMQTVFEEHVKAATALSAFYQNHPEIVAQEMEHLPKKDQTNIDRSPWTIVTVYMSKADQRRKSIFDLQRRLGYPSFEVLYNMLKNKSIVNTDIVYTDLMPYKESLNNHAGRLLNVMTSQTNKSSTTPTVTSIGELINADLIFDRVGNTYLYLEDRFHKLRAIYHLADKQTDTIVEHIRELASFYKSYGKQIRKIVTDDEATFRAMSNPLGRIGIQVGQTSPGDHNKIIERSVRTLKSMVYTIKSSLSYELPDVLMPKLFYHAVHLLNRSWNTNSGSSTPWEIHTGMPLDLKNYPLLPFGTVGIFFQDKSLRTAANPDRAEFGIVVGKNFHQPTAIEIYSPQRNSFLMRSMNVRILEGPPRSWNWRPNHQLATADQLRQPHLDPHRIHQNNRQQNRDRINRYALPEDDVDSDDDMPELIESDDEEGVEPPPQESLSYAQQSQHVDMEFGSDSSSDTRADSNNPGQNSTIIDLTHVPSSHDSSSSSSSVSSSDSEGSSEMLNRETDDLSSYADEDDIGYWSEPPQRSAFSTTNCTCRQARISQLRLRRSGFSSQPAVNYVIPCEKPNNNRKVGFTSGNGESESNIVPSSTAMDVPCQPSRVSSRKRRMSTASQAVPSCDQSSESLVPLVRPPFASPIAENRVYMASAARRSTFPSEKEDMVTSKTQNHPSGRQAAKRLEIRQMVDKDVMTPLTKAEYLSIVDKYVEIDAMSFTVEKFNADGSFNKYKDRLVARGDQQPMYPSSQSSSPTANMHSVMVMLSAAAHHGSYLYSSDVPGAYLHADIDVPVIMRMPRDSVDAYLEVLEMDHDDIDHHVDEKGNMYVLLKKSLYGLKQSSLLWYKNIKETLETMGFTMTDSDPCMFTAVVNGHEYTILLYVDDLLHSCHDETTAKIVADQLTQRYGVMDHHYGLSISFLSLSIVSSPNHRIIKISQTGYIRNFISEVEKKYEIVPSVFPASRMFLDPISMSGGTVLDKKRARVFRSYLMTLMYVALRTRFDIQFVVVCLSSYMQKPTDVHLQHLFKLIGYLKVNSDVHLTYGSVLREPIEAYIDASFALYPDMKGQSSIVVKCYGNTVICRSHKQSLVTKSSTEAELFAMSDMLGDALWVRSLLQEIVPSYTAPVKVYQDNQASISILTNESGSYRKCRHYMIRLAWIKQWVTNGTITVHYCDTNNMQADLLTKIFYNQHFYELLVSIACNPLIMEDGISCTLAELERFGDLRIAVQESGKKTKKTSSSESVEEI